MSMLSRFATLGGANTDPYWNNVSLLLNGDGTNDSTVFNDLSSSPKTVTAYGNARINTTIKKYGTGSMYFDGANSSALSIQTPNINIGTGDFTVEAWAYYLDIVNWRDIICFVGSSINWGITTNNGDLGAYGIGINSSGTTVPVNQWFHVAVSKKSNTVRLFFNGNLIALANNSASLTPTKINIGCWSATTSENLNGYIDELRITKNIARYTANFTPPTSPFPIG